MRILFLFLLVVGPWCVRGQGLLIGDSALQGRLFVSGRAEVRVMQPDRMPCVVANLAVVEPMPVDRRGSGDRMPVDRGSGEWVLVDRIPDRVKGLLAPR
ncbi:MAG TPA: hypothetical protein VHE34_05525 [Puia sp.]|uniref:hypothetical protein n=1 Tax=Puia sp. TaxID=2045100 RepID=UPI002CCD1B40|nr:hypothetical protein [Puia sp.]HVU94660.1 hypothetical protein [Puia sp.]